MNGMPFIYRICILLLPFFILSCSDREHLTKDISAYRTKIRVERFDHDLFERDSSELATFIPSFRDLYPEFSDYFFNVFIKDHSNRDTSFLNSALYFTSLPSAKHFYDTTQLVFSDFRPYTNKLEEAFAYYSYYFEDSLRPVVITLVSELGIGSFTIEDQILGIGLDFFLGEKFTGYDAMGLPLYIRKTLTPDHLVSKSMHAWIRRLTHKNEFSKDVLDAMIKNGKVLYIKERLMPEERKEVIFEVNSRQLNWLESNVADMWAFVLEKDLLYKKDLKSIERMTGAGPTTQGMPADSPGGALNYLGYKIVEAYMKRNPEVTFRQLAELHDSQQILQKSKFKPILK